MGIFSKPKVPKPPPVPPPPAIPDVGEDVGEEAARRVRRRGGIGKTIKAGLLTPAPRGKSLLG